MKIIYNPFEKVSERKLLSFGLLLTLAGSFTGWFFNARYDGIIDMHLNPAVRPWQPLTDNVINTLVLAVFLYLPGRYINNKTRFIDILNAALIARSPFYILPIFNAGDYLNNTTEKIMNAGPDIATIGIAALIFTIIFTLVTIALLIWAMALLYNGFKTAVYSKTTKQVVAFIVTVLIAEALSKFLIITIPY